MEDSKKWCVIINPTSGNGRSKRLWPKIKLLLEAGQFEFKFRFTEYHHHSIEIIHQSVYQGFRHFICVGGDGTIHNIVNAIMSQNHIPSTDIHLGVIPIGSGNDWVKSHQIPKRPEAAIRIIKNGRTAHQDIGKIELENTDRPPIYFNNLAGVGFDGYVVRKAKHYKHFGALSYLLGALTGLFSFKNFDLTAQFNSEIITSKVFMLLIGLCSYSGGGMQLTKDPDPCDGYFDISIAMKFKKSDVLLNVFKLFNGKITASKKVFTSKTSSISVSVDETRKPIIEADGEIVGSGNFKVTLIPKALSYYK